MSSFDIAYKNTLTHEGGYVSPEIAASISDPGGETYKGITRRYHPTWKGWGLIDIYKSKNSAWQYYNKTRYFGLPHGSFIDNATIDQLHKDYMKVNFWDVNKLSLFKNQSLANYVYDIGYGSGPGTAAKSLQTVLGVEADGKIGNVTIAKLNSVNQELVFNKLKEFRQSWLNRNVKGKSYKKVLDQRNDSFFFHRKYIAGALILSLVGLIIYNETQTRPQRKLKTA